MSKPTAKTFRDAFVQSYSSTCDLFAPEDWKAVWLRWNDLMLPLETEGSRLPKSTMQASVLAKTADALGLRFLNREMLRLDAIFTQKEDWFPIIAAVEHENDSKGFISEIIKLLSVRCPLKVGITYMYAREGREVAMLEEIELQVRESYDAIKQVIAEDATTEYLFLVGIETVESPKAISRWYSLDFSAATGPRNAFELVRS